jgi:hypothetical protein
LLEISSFLFVSILIRRPQTSLCPIKNITNWRKTFPHQHVILKVPIVKCILQVNFDGVLQRHSFRISITDLIARHMIQLLSSKKTFPRLFRRWAPTTGLCFGSMLHAATPGLNASLWQKKNLRHLFKEGFLLYNYLCIVKNRNWLEQVSEIYVIKKCVITNM